MKEVYKHIKGTRDFLSGCPEAIWEYTIIPKEFEVERVSASGKKYFSFEEGEVRNFSGISMTQQNHGAVRVFFFPYSFQDIENPSLMRFLEIKGYGQRGRDICLWLHEDGDILFGMFYKNARKEFNILNKAYANSLKVPLPLFLGKISKEEWLKSGLRVVKSLAEANGKEELNIEELTMYNNCELREKINELVPPLLLDKDPLSAFSQPYDAGVLGRAPISPFRIGDPNEKYEINEKNISIAKVCGKTFLELIGLGYFHLCPGTCNWTTAGELTDMADCYDLRKDKNLENIIKKRESRTQKDFWQDLIGKRHTANLFLFFIEGIFNTRISLQEAAQELKKIVLEKEQSLKIKNSA